jgi:5-carboxymethyl-2-hydroxymuconate isomerase
MGHVKSIHHPIDIDELMREIERYLAVVAVFRAAGCDVGGMRRRASRL